MLTILVTIMMQYHNPRCDNNARCNIRHSTGRGGSRLARSRSSPTPRYDDDFDDHDDHDHDDHTVDDDDGEYHNADEVDDVVDDDFPSPASEASYLLPITR